MLNRDFYRRTLSRSGSQVWSRASIGVAVLSMLVPGLAWGAAGTAQGSAGPFPSDSQPQLGGEYTVNLRLSNTSTSYFGNPFQLSVTSATYFLACTTSDCPEGTGVSAVQFEPNAGTANHCEPGTDACVTDCAAGTDPVSGADTVVLGLSGCALDPGQINKTIAIVKVRQIANPGDFVIKGAATYQGTAGSCTAADNTECSNAPGELCTPATEAADCSFSEVTGTATGNAGLIP